MQIVLTLKTYLVSDLQNPFIKIPIWQDTHTYEIPTVSKQLSETVRIDNDNAYGNNVSNVDNSSGNTRN